MSFTIESSSMTVTVSLFFLVISLVFLQHVVRWLLLFLSICTDLSHAPSSELSFPIVSVGFSSRDKIVERLVLSIKVLRWSNLNALPVFWGGICNYRDAQFLQTCRNCKRSFLQTCRDWSCIVVWKWLREKLFQ